MRWWWGWRYREKRNFRLLSLRMPSTDTTIVMPHHQTEHQESRIWLLCHQPRVHYNFGSHIRISQYQRGQFECWGFVFSFTKWYNNSINTEHIFKSYWIFFYIDASYESLHAIILCKWILFKSVWFYWNS